MYYQGTRQVRSGVSGDRSPRRARLVHRGYVYTTRFPRGRVNLTGQQVSLGAGGLGEQRAGARDQLDFEFGLGRKGADANEAV